LAKDIHIRDGKRGQMLEAETEVRTLRSRPIGQNLYVEVEAEVRTLRPRTRLEP